MDEATAVAENGRVTQVGRTVHRIRGVEPTSVIGALVFSLLLAALPHSTNDDRRPDGVPGTLEQQLRQEDPAAVARDARRLGDARRGALVFYQPALACARCHTGEGASAATLLGPDLAEISRDVSDVDRVRSILEPSKVIAKGYETVTIATDDGRTVTGLLAAETPEALVIRDVRPDGKPVTIARSRIEQESRGGPSLMPAGLVGALSSRQQFLDLVRYLIEIGEHGPARARALRPDPALVSPPLPDYERQLDHTGMIAGLGPEHFRRGEAIYGRVCGNCHGTRDQPGSLPSAPRFASATLKNGADPYSMYRTLTDGFGQMAAQTWMVPRQKYDVIHYIREAYLRPYNAGQYVHVDRADLSRLPKGTSRGPEPSEIEPWVIMDYGPSLMATYEIRRDGSNFAYKGIAIRLDSGQGGVSRGCAWMVYDHDTLRLAAAWTGQGFIDWNGINFNSRHQVHPRIVGQVHVANPDGPGWANPEKGGFIDGRLRGRDGRRYGPLPRTWGHYEGVYHHGDQVILAYKIGTTRVLEMPGREIDSARPERPIFTRTLEIGPSPKDLIMRVAPHDVAVGLVGESPEAPSQNIPFTLLERDGFSVLAVPRSGKSRLVKVLMSSAGVQALDAYRPASPPATPLEPLTHGGPRRWAEIQNTRAVIGRDDGPFAVDVLTLPETNPWLCQIRASGFDFLPGGRRAALCTWDGDVWLVGGIDLPQHGLTWQRIASGLFQPLGLKVVGEQIYVGCRDQIVHLRDLNGDGETDFYESFNSDHQVTEHFHEFAMGLQVDTDGNFYYAKAARHGLPAVVPQHGTLLRVGRSGESTEILATGFRAPNGVCLNPDGTFFLSDQEGFWLPKNRINWVKRGGFYGNMWGYHDVTDPSDDAMEPPVCWITNAFDRSPAELVRVESPSPAWAPLRGALLSLSYGNGKVFVVPHEIVGGQMQGGMCALPMPAFPTGVMRGRFHPSSGQLFTCGLFGWAGDRTRPGGFYRVRATGKPIVVPIGLRAQQQGVAIRFSGPLDRKTGSDPARYTARTWSLKRSVEYGSKHYDEREARITKATVADDGRTIFLAIPILQPTWCMEITFAIRAEGGEPVEGAIDNTIHQLGD
jgi:putative heme-binding domain-containing protein